MDGIRLKSVSARFRHQVKGDIAAVHDVSLDVAPGELMTLLGPSGCGKTTTLRMIAGFQEPSAGEICIGERDVTGIEANAAQHRLRVPELRAVSASLGVRERRLWAEGPAHGGRRDRAAPSPTCSRWSGLPPTSGRCRISSPAASSSASRSRAPS